MKARRRTWKQAGWTVVPNISVYGGLPANVIKTLMVLQMRAFGGKAAIKHRVETIAADAGFCRRTVQTHLNVLELAGFIKRIRRGEGLCNVILLTLKKKAVMVKTAIEGGLPELREDVVDGVRRTMKWWRERWKIRVSAFKVVT